MQKPSEAEARKARNKYHREWARKHPERIKEINQRFYLKRLEEMRQQNQQPAHEPVRGN